MSNNKINIIIIIWLIAMHCDLVDLLYPLLSFDPPIPSLLLVQSNL